MADTKTTKKRKVAFNPYGNCWYCGGEVTEQLQTIDYRLEGKLFILENIPTGVCSQCGEKFFTAKISKKMETLVTTAKPPKKTAVIPILTI